MTTPPRNTLTLVLRSGLALKTHDQENTDVSGDRSPTESTHMDMHFPRDSALSTGMFWKRAGGFLDESDPISPGYRRNTTYQLGAGVRNMVGGGAGWLADAADKGPLMGALGYGLPAAALGGIGGLIYDGIFKPEGEAPKAGLSTVAAGSLGAILGGLSGAARSNSASQEDAARRIIMYNLHNLEQAKQRGYPSRLRAELP